MLGFDESQPATLLGGSNLSAKAQIQVAPLGGAPPVPVAPVAPVAPVPPVACPPVWGFRAVDLQSGPPI